MRTLIIDNYDSFTYNLFHMIAEVNGEVPFVIMNDEANWHIDQLAYFDNVVISPGPGHPKRDEDFGICREVIACAKIPVLGVCLGHQGISLNEGACVDLAPEPRHGRLSEVSHTGVEILRDIPSPFAVVRYHSLAVTDLPSTLEAIGYAEDGVLMAIRHKERPLWGVQFHPESISSSFGTQIIRNFAALTRQWQTEGRCSSASVAPLPPYLTNQHRYEHPSRPATDQIGPLRQNMSILTKRVSSTLQTEHVFESFFRKSDHAFWLDSSLTNVPFGRFSFMGDANGPLARVATARVSNGTVTVQGAHGKQVIQSGFFDWIAEDLAKIDISAPNLPFEFALGWIGYLGYELKAECYADEVHQSEHPDAVMIFADRALAFDHSDGSIYLLALAPAGDPVHAQQWIDDTYARLLEMATYTRTKLPIEVCELLDDELTLRHSHGSYLNLVERSKDAIVAGETYEVCLTNMITASADIDPWSTYCTLRKNNPAPFAAYLQLDQLWVLSGSPERFLSISRNGMVEAKPIKGTRPRGESIAEDKRLTENLRNSEKDRAENLMIVDLIRNDLSTCADIGSVWVPKLFEIESYVTVHQMVSTIHAHLRDEISAVDCVRAAFPGGSMTGAPKIRTMQILDQFEAGARGIYSGSLGYFSLSGAVDFNIVIRTMVVTPGRVSFGVGGAITALSDAADEFEETAVKATSLLRIFNAQFPGREVAAEEKLKSFVSS